MTWTWPLQSGPAPMPIVGMRRRSVIAPASWAGTSSRTIENAPASWTASASASSPRARVAVLALDLDLAAHAVLGLGRPADVAHDRDPGPDEGLDDASRSDATLDLDRLGAGVLQEAAGVLERFLRRGVGQERHVADDHRAPRAAHDGPGVMEHLGHRHADGRLVAEQDLAERIADEDERHVGRIEDPGRRVVVGGQHRDALPVGVAAGDVGNGQAARLVGRGAHARVGLRAGRIGYREVCASASRASSSLATRSSSRSATTRLGSMRQVLPIAIGREDADPVRVGPEPRARFGDVVRDQQVDALAPQLVGRSLEGSGLRGEPDEDRSRRIGPSRPLREVGEDVRASARGRG